MPPRDNILLAGTKFELAVDAHNARLFSTAQRDSQAGDPSELLTAEWRVDGHDLNSLEQIPLGQSAGYLARDYGSSTDGRFLCDTLGPLLNTITLSTYDLAWSPSIPSTPTFIPSVNLIPGGAPGATASDALGMAVQFGIGPTPYAIIIRGSQPAKVDLTDMTVKRSGELLPEAATSIVATRTAANVREISVGMGVTPYRVLTALAAPPNSDTWTTNSQSQVARTFGIAPDRIVGLNGVTQQVLGNVMTGSVTMAAPNWATVATLNAFEVLQFNGFAVDGSLWIIGTSNGPYVLDSDTREFTPLIDEIDNNNLNGYLATWFPAPVGVLILLSDGLRQQRAGNGASVGPEMFKGNTSPVQGRPGAAAGSTHWLYTTEYNPITGDTYLLAWQPRAEGDQHDNVLTPYTIGKLTAMQSRFLDYIGTVNGVRTNPTLMGGAGSNAFWMTVGRTAREIDDANYRYAPSGTTYLTELRRRPGVLVDLEAIELETQHCSVSRTVTVSTLVTYPNGTTATIAFPTITTNGFHRLLASDAGVPVTTLEGLIRNKPQIAYATDDSTQAPQTIGTFREFYRARPLRVRVFSVTLVLGDTGTSVTEDKEKIIEALSGRNGPVALQSWDRDTVYVRVDSVTCKEQVDRGGGADSSRGSKRIAELTMTEWQTVS